MAAVVVETTDNVRRYETILEIVVMLVETTDKVFK